MRYLNQPNHQQLATGNCADAEALIADHILAMLRVADTDDMDALLSIIARILAARICQRPAPGTRNERAQSLVDEIELLFSLELFPMTGDGTANGAWMPWVDHTTWRTDPLGLVAPPGSTASTDGSVRHG